MCTFNKNDVLDGHWSDWSQWSECSATCGKGLRLQTRQCIDLSEKGKQCNGSTTKTSSCNVAACLMKNTLGNSK